MRFALCAVVSIALFASCQCTNPSCTDECATMQTRCVGTSVELCEVGPSRCLVWSAPQSCGAGQVCSGSGCTTSCSPTNACTSVGATQCSGTKVQTCGVDSAGCLSWSTATACGGQQSCSGSACTACSATGACSTNGATQCSGSKVQTCAADSNGCLAWSTPESCGSQRFCSGASCGACSASNACTTIGLTQCAGNQVQTCAADSNGCLAWSAPSACGGQQYCSGTTCTACPTTNACSTAFATQCSGTQVQTCTADSTGCLAWSAAASCGSQHFCSGSACVACSATNACASVGATRCVGTQVETCASDVSGCLTWSAPSTCGGTASCIGSSCASTYVFASGGSVMYAFTFDPATGALHERDDSPLPVPGTRAALHPSGKYLYSSDYGSNHVGAYSVTPDAGLAAIGSLLNTGSSPETIVVNPQGTYVYVGNVFGGGTSIYQIDQTTGGLTATTALNAGLYNHGLAFDPSGTYFYLARNNANDVTRYVLNATTGQLADPTTLTAAGGYHAMMDPFGRFLFVSDWDKSGANLLSTYWRSSSDGTLTHASDSVTGGGNPAGVAVTPNGKFVYVVNYNSGSVAGFSISTTNTDGGVLAPVPGSPFAVGSGAWELSIEPGGTALFIGHGAAISSLLIDQATGVLTLAPGSPLSVRNAGATVGATLVVPMK